MINNHHTISSQCLQLIEQIETLRLQPYDDQTSKQITAWCEGATIGYGHLIQKKDWPLFQNGITDYQAIDLLSYDLAPFEQAIQKSITTPLLQQHYDALLLLAFNIGEDGFCKSSVVKLINNPNAVTNYSNLEAAWKAWNKDRGHVVNGLVNRRACEWNVWTMGIYEHW